MPVRIAAGGGLIRDQLGEWLHDEDFARAFGNRGRPGCGDPSGRYLLLTYGGPARFFTGWIDHSKLRFLPIAQPHLGYPISA